MRAFHSVVVMVAAALWVTPSVESFSVTPLLLTRSTCTSTRHQAATATSIALNAQSETSSRRSFMNSASCVMISAATATAVGISSAAPVWAVEDLAMPTAEEQKKIDDDAMAERLRRKAELQKMTAAPKGFQDSLSKEKEKQKGMKSLSQEERRNAMCEELGRGC